MDYKIYQSAPNEKERNTLMYKFIGIIWIALCLFMGLHSRIDPIALICAGFLGGQLFTIWLEDM